MSEFAGSLRERILIEKLTTTRTAAGLQETAWLPVARCLASVTVEGLGEQSEAMALSAMPRMRVTIRARRGITVDQRISWRSRTLMIRSVIDDPLAPERLVLRCEEVRA